MLYKRSKQLGQGLYLVEISTNQSHLFIAAFDVETDESLLIELPEKKANDILEEFNHDYEQLASSLQVLNKRLVLLNPVRIQTLLTIIVLVFRNSFSRSESVQRLYLGEKAPAEMTAKVSTPLMRVICNNNSNSNLILSRFLWKVSRIPALLAIMARTSVNQQWTTKLSMSRRNSEMKSYSIRKK